jgi:hypothetical protein
VERLMNDTTKSPLTAREIAKRLPIRVPVAIVARICFDLVSLGKLRNATSPRQRAVRFLRR